MYHLYAHARDVRGRARLAQKAAARAACSSAQKARCGAAAKGKAAKVQQKACRKKCVALYARVYARGCTKRCTKRSIVWPQDSMIRRPSTTPCTPGAVQHQARLYRGHDQADLDRASRSIQAGRRHSTRPPGDGHRFLQVVRRRAT